MRSTIQSALGENEQIVIQQIIPTLRVKRVIELAFREARSRGDGAVGTEHLLVGLLIEGEGIAAHVLDKLGATLDNVSGEIDRLHLEMGAESAAGDEGGGLAGNQRVGWPHRNQRVSAGPSGRTVWHGISVQAR